MSLGSALFVLGCEGAEEDVPVDEHADVVSLGDVVSVHPCDVPGVPAEAVRCFDPPLEGLVAVGSDLMALRRRNTTQREVVLVGNHGAILDTLVTALERTWDIAACGAGACVLMGALEDTSIRMSSLELSVVGGALVAEVEYAPIVLPRRGIRPIVAEAEHMTLLVGDATGPWQRCVLSMGPTCEDIPIPVDCPPGELRYLTSAVDGPTTTVVAGFCEIPRIASWGIGHPFVFAWDRANGVAWTTAPSGWTGRLSHQLHPDTLGYWAVANRLPQGGTDDGGVPTGLSLVHIAPDGVPGAVWDSPLQYGAPYYYATAAVQGTDLLVAWIGTSGESASEARLTQAKAGGTPTTTTIAPVGYQPDTLVAFGDGYVLNLSGRLVRLDAAGTPVAWPAAP